MSSLVAVKIKTIRDGRSHGWQMGTKISFFYLAAIVSFGVTACTSARAQSGTLASFATPPATTAENIYPTTTEILAENTNLNIVFYSERDGDAEIYLMNPDGSHQRPITDNNADDFSPVWSPDHSQIVFESDRDDTQPRTCFPNCNYNLYIMNADGSGQRQLTSAPGAEWHASWSPDGKHLAYTAGDIGFIGGALYIMDMQTGQSTLLLGDGFKDVAADWSPEGTQLVFTSYREGTMDIYVMNADGTDIRKLYGTNLQEYGPEWSPDGNRILFYVFDLPAIKQDIYVMDADGSNVQNLTNTAKVVDEAARWSPDGSQILFHTDRDGNFEVYIMNADGSQPVNLTRDRGQDYCPDW
jgi:Tol biopolymer transport system component